MGLLRRLLRLLTRPIKFRTHRRYPTISSPPPMAQPQAGPQVQVPLASVVGFCYVVDGDTITIGNTSIRLAGIDAPELDQPWGKKAKWELLALTKGQIIRAELDGSMSYERTVARCYLPDGRDLSLEMVKMGLALDWGRFSGGEYRAYEPPGIRKKLWRVAAKHRGQFPPST